MIRHTLLYKLDEAGEPIPCADTREWADWYARADRGIARTDLGHGAYVSTVFTGTDHRVPSDRGPPILYETRVFGGSFDGEEVRSSTRTQAKAAHATMVLRARSIELRETKPS